MLTQKIIRLFRYQYWLNRPILTALHLILVIIAVSWFYRIFFYSVSKEKSKQLNSIEHIAWRKAQALKTIKEFSKLNIKNEIAICGILVVLDADAALKYAQQINSLRCYANRHNYTFHLLEPSFYTDCISINNFFFRKHCGVAFYLIQNPMIEWVLVLDADNLIVNGTKRIEDFIPTDDTTHIVHYERFYNGEIMAGNYLIQNHEWSYSYLLRWANLDKYLPNVYYHNNDNGALHIHILLILNKSIDIVHNCFSLWNISIDEVAYDQYVGCAKCAIAGRRNFTHIRILRRGQGFARDYREPENLVLETDFLLHSFKSDTNLYYSYKVQTTSCTKIWEPPIHEFLIEHNLTIARNLIEYYDKLATIKHPFSVGWPDVGHCWPNCEMELDIATEKQLLKSMCK